MLDPSSARLVQLARIAMKPATKVLLKWVLLLLLFVAIWQFLSPEPGHERPGPPSAPPTSGSWLPMVLLFGVVFSALLVRLRVFAAANAQNALLRASNAHLDVGRFDEAERAVAGLEQSRFPQFRRAFHVQRAEIAARRGARDEALARVEPAIAEPIGWLFRASQRTTAHAARGLRAFLRASAGDDAGARDDIAALRAQDDVESSALVRAALAEAFLLDRAGDTAALREHLARSRALVLEAASPHERALLRAYEAMLEADAGSVYRRKGDRAAASDAGAVAAWVAGYAPNAAPFVRAVGVASADGGEAAPAPTPSAEAQRKVAASRPGKVKVGRANTGTALAILMVLFGVFSGLWSGFTDSPYSGLWKVIAVFVALIVGVGAWTVRNIRREARNERRINAAFRALSAGDLARAAADIDFVPRSAKHRVQVAHGRAEIALRSGAMGEALVQCDRAFIALAEVQGGTLVAPVAPAAGAAVAWDMARILAAQRSFALAALGRGDEALAEIAWAQGFPTALAALRVRLLTHLVARDFEAAARVAAARDPAELIPVRDEVLADLAVFVGRARSRTEAESARLSAELRRDPALSRWIDAVAPGLTAAFAGAVVALTGAAEAAPL